MSNYTRLGFKALYDNTGGPFASTGAGSMSGLTLQQFAEDIADSCLFEDQSVNTDRNYFENSDFLFPQSGVSPTSLPNDFFVNSSGLGAVAAYDTFGINATEKALGSMSIETGSTSSGRISMIKGLTSLKTGYALMRVRMRVGLQTLSTGGETYTTYIGFGDTVASGDQANGCYFRYTHSVNSGKWEAVTAAASVRTATDTGVTAVTTYSIFEVRINAAGTSVEYYIDDVLVATNTTNIPSAVFGMIFKIEKSAGSTTRANHIDWYDFLISLTSAR